MIDGINGGGGPVQRPRWLQPGPVEAGHSDPASPVQRSAAITGNGRSQGGGALTRAALVKDMAASPPVDSARVAALQAEIAAGRYRIDADAIAGAMLALDRGR